MDEQFCIPPTPIHSLYKKLSISFHIQMISLGDVDTIYSRFSKLVRRFRQCSANPDLYDEIQSLSNEFDAAYQNLNDDCERFQLEQNQVKEIRLRTQNIRAAIEKTEVQLERLRSRNVVNGSIRINSQSMWRRIRRDPIAATTALAHTYRDAAELNELRDRIRFEMNQITRIRLALPNQGLIQWRDAM